MKAFKRFSLALVALMIMAAMLVACGDSPTAVPAATTAAATTAPKPTTAAPTTAAATTAAATTAPATTAAAAGVLPVPTGAKTVTIADGLTKELVTQFTSSFSVDAGKVGVEAYSITQSPADVSAFFDTKLVSNGYTTHPETQKAQQIGSVNVLSAAFTKTTASGGTEALSIVLFGPLDADTISQIAEPINGTSDPNFAKQLKTGDTLILSFDFTLPAGVSLGGTATTAAATVAAQPTPVASKTTAAAASSTFPAPANGRVLNLSAAGDKAVFGDYGSNGISSTGSALTITTYLVQGRADTLSMFYDQAMTTIGYAAHPESNTGDVKGTVSYISQNYTKGTADTYVYLIGPLDQTTIDYVASQVKTAGATDDIASQMQVGDTIIRAYEGTIAATTTTVAATTAAASGSAIPLPSGATELKLSDSLKTFFLGEYSGDAKTPTITGYTVTDDPDSLTSFFENQLPGVGYTLVPDSQSKSDQAGGVMILQASFAKGSDLLVVTIVGPLDQDTLNIIDTGDLNHSDPSTSVKSQIKVGETLVFVANGTK